MTGPQPLTPLVALLGVLVAGCAAAPPSAGGASSGRDLGNAVRAAADGAGEAHYFDARVDLDGDGQQEVLAYVAGPMACGTGGCTLYVFTPGTGIGGYRLVSRIGVTQVPVRLSPRSSAGWRNLVVRIGGGGGRSGDVEVRFDGTSYVPNPTVLEPMPARDVEALPVLIPDFESFRDGKPLPAPFYGDPSLPRAATVLGLPVHTRDPEEVLFVVQRRLSDRFAEQEGITVTHEEIVAYSRQVDEALRRDGIRPPAVDTAEDRAAREEIAGAFIRHWKIHRALHRRYGGRIVFQQGGPEPLDAWRRFLEEGQDRGDFVLHDRTMAPAFWRYFVTDSMHSFYKTGSTEEARAFETPPWASAK